MSSLTPFDMLACPICHGHLYPVNEKLQCAACSIAYRVDDDIPMLFVPNDAVTHDVTDTVKAFYERNPFPNYDDLDSAWSLREKANRGLFARLLDEQIPPGAIVLEVGCGTGQFTNFLGMCRNRVVFGSDMCMNSLRLGKEFRDRNSIKNARFLQMNLFRPAFRESSFDIVICNGVLHHTGDPLGGFRSIARLVKPGGVIIIGLYNKIARLTTDFKRFLFRISSDRLKFLDAHIRNPNYNEARKRAWFFDQYKHPHESKHSFDDLMGWFESEGFEFCFSIPKIDPTPFSESEQLFAKHGKGTKMDRLATQVGMLLRGGVDGGLYVMIARNLKASKPETTPAMTRGA